MIEQYQSKVNRILAAIICCGIVTNITVLYLGIMHTYVSLVTILICGPLSMFLQRKPENRQKVKILNLVAGTVIALSLLLELPNEAIGFSFLLIAASAMYFEMTWPIVLGLLTQAVITYNFVVRHALDISMFSFTSISLIFTIAVLYFITLSGKKMITLSQTEQENASRLLGELENTMNVVRNSTLELDGNILASNEHIVMANEKSDVIADSMEEMSEGITSQTDNLNAINTMMMETERKVVEVNQLSENLTSIAKDAEKSVSIGYENITHMDSQMKQIKEASGKAFTTIQELGENIEAINRSLSGITQIASQTNLLALNASIEASRAGEAGRGFAVVAEEIRDLAEQSRRTVNEISSVIAMINGKMEHVLAESEVENAAAKEGETMVIQVEKSFDDIKQAFKNIDGNLIYQFEKMNHVSTIFTDMAGKVEEVTAISEKHSIHTQNLKEIVRENSDNVTGVSVAIQKMKESSNELQKTIV